MRPFLIQDFLPVPSECKHMALCRGWVTHCLGQAAWVLLPGWSLAASTLQEAQTWLPFTLSHVMVSSSHNILIKFGLVFLSHLTLCIKGEAFHMLPGWGPCNSSLPKAGCFVIQGEQQLNQSRGYPQLLGERAAHNFNVTYMNAMNSIMQIYMWVKWEIALHLVVHWVLGNCHTINNSSCIVTCYVNDSLCILMHLPLRIKWAAGAKWLSQDMLPLLLPSEFNSSLLRIVMRILIE